MEYLKIELKSRRMNPATIKKNIIIHTETQLRWFDKPFGDTQSDGEYKMTRHIIFLGATLSLLLAFSLNSHAMDIYNMADQATLRCSGGVIAIEAMDREVLDKCGEPVDVQWVQDVGDVWIYTAGQSKFMYYLAFLHGRLQRIASAPCNYNDYECFDLR